MQNSTRRTGAALAGLVLVASLATAPAAVAEEVGDGQGETPVVETEEPVDGTGAEPTTPEGEGTDPDGTDPEATTPEDDEPVTTPEPTDPQPAAPEEPQPEEAQPEEGDEVADVAPVVTLLEWPGTLTTERTATFRFAADQQVTWAFALNGTALDTPGSSGLVVMTDVPTGSNQLQVIAMNADGVYSEWTLSWFVAGAGDGLQRLAVRPGADVEMYGDGFQPGEDVTAWLRTDPQIALGATVADSTGRATHRFAVPDLTAGAYLVELRGAGWSTLLWIEVSAEGGDGGAVDSQPVGSTPGLEKVATGTDPDALAQTGANPWSVAGVAALALVAGAGAVVVSRRRTSGGTTTAAIPSA